MQSPRNKPVTQKRRHPSVPELNRKVLDFLQENIDSMHPEARSKTDAVITINSRTKIVSWNHAAEAVFGYTASEAVGNDLTLIIPEDYVKLNQYKMQLIAESGLKKIIGNPVEIVARKKDGSDLIVECFPTMQKIKKQLLFTITARDTSSGDLPGVPVHELGSRLTDFASNLKKHIQNVVKTAGTILNGSFALYQVEEGLLVRTVAGWETPHNLKKLAHKNGSLFHHVFTAGKKRPLCIHDLDKTSFAESDPLIKQNEIRSVIGCTVHKGRKTVGILYVFYKHVKIPGNSELRFLAALAQGLEHYMDLVERFKQNQQRLRISESYVKRLARGMLEVAEMEKKNLSDILHNELGSMAIALSSYLAIAEKQIKDGDPSAALVQFVQVRKVLEGSVNSLKEIAVNLRPPEFDMIGLQSVLNNFFLTIEEQSDIKIDFRWLLDGKKLSDNIAIALYRLIQEALNNIVKYSGANNASIVLRTQRKQVQLKIADDGKGFDCDAFLKKRQSSQMGIRGMKERTESLGGRFSIASQPRAGTTINIHIPHNEV